jgi:tRNA threonylcarbamoyl adenosine modification protein (Sua5/YciO/YrdC/YwlC family)
MARYFDIHPLNPQPRLISQIAAMLRAGALIAYPTDSCYALGAELGNQAAIERIRAIRKLDESHHYTLVCADLEQVGKFVRMDNSMFRAVKASTPGPYTFILPATKDVPRRTAHAKRKTVGVRIPDHPVANALVTELGEPLVSSTLLLPGEEIPMLEGWMVKEELDAFVDAVVDSGECGTEPTTVIDWSHGFPDVVRVGAGDPEPFE